MTMIEMVARAQWEARRRWAANETPDYPLEEWGDGSVPKANGIMEEALAAIEAMRPFGKMVEDDQKTRPHEDSPYLGGFLDDYSTETVWEGVIDAALR